MSIKDDVNYVKKELSGDEKVLESAFKLETLYKKHKFKIWGVAVALVLYFGGQETMNAMHEAKLVAANEAFLTLEKKSDDQNALKILEENNPALFELYSFTKAAKKKNTERLATLAKSQNSIVSDASSYTENTLKRKPSNSKLYKELALFEEAYLAIKSGDTKTAKDKLALIDERSPLAVITGFLKHSMIKAN